MKSVNMTGKNQQQIMQVRREAVRFLRQETVRARGLVVRQEAVRARGLVVMQEAVRARV